jgi:hypothetical protein
MVEEENNGYKYALSRRIMMSGTLTGAIIYGVQRAGKSSYALQVMYDVYKDWDIVLKNCLFKLEDVISFLQERMKSREIVSAFCWDDAGVHGSCWRYFSHRDEVELLKSLFDVIGTKCRSCLFTTPYPDGLLKSLRSYEFYRVKISKENSRDRRLARGYQSVLLPSGSRYIRKEFIDHYSVWLPDDIYKEYMVMREGYLEEVLCDLSEHVKDTARKKVCERRGMEVNEWEEENLAPYTSS